MLFVFSQNLCKALVVHPKIILITKDPAIFRYYLMKLRPFLQPPFFLWLEQDTLQASYELQPIGDRLCGSRRRNTVIESTLRAWFAA